MFDMQAKPLLRNLGLVRDTYHRMRHVRRLGV
jgi:hypothetical protein